MSYWSAGRATDYDKIPSPPIGSDTYDLALTPIARMVQADYPVAQNTMTLPTLADDPPHCSPRSSGTTKLTLLAISSHIGLTAPYYARLTAGKTPVEWP